MVVQRLHSAIRYGKMVLGKLSSWMATDLGIVCSTLASAGSIITLFLYLVVLPQTATCSTGMVDRPNSPADPQTITVYYSASHEAEDTLQIDREVFNMSFNAKQFREKIKAVLTYLDPAIPYSDEAVELLMLTAAQESQLGTYLKQVKGPARGVFQIEPTTEIDMWRTLATDHFKLLRKKISELRSPMELKDATNMELNLGYQIAMARFYYFRIPASLPSPEPEELAKYWKRFYNTYLGKGTVEEAVKNYDRFAI